MQRKEGAYLQALVLPFHFWLWLLASYFCLFVSSTFSLAFSSSQVGKRKRNTKKQIIEKKKTAKKGRSLPFFFRFCIW